MLEVTVAVAGTTVPAWHQHCIEALRGVGETLQVRVVATGAAAWTPPRGLAARLAGSALAPVRVRTEPGGLDGADIVLNLTSSAVDADAPLGVWSFRLERSDDASFPFAREIAGGAGTLEVALLRMRGTRTDVIRRGRFGVMIWHPTTLRTIFRIAAAWPATLAAAAAGGLEIQGGTAPVATRRRSPERLERARFAASLAWRVGASVLHQLLFVEGWDVGLVRMSRARLLSGEPLDVRWIFASDRATFCADPFLIERDGRRAILFEAYDRQRERGVIEAALLDASDLPVQRALAIDEATHLSYPYPFEADGELFLVLENCASNEVPLYRCEEFPWRWKREPPLFSGLDGVDTSLFEHGGRLWAFCTRYSHGSTLALYAYHAVSLRGPWSAHALNPILVDVASARPAGRPFVVGGVTYRPGQDCSKSYGSGLVLARVDELTPTSYRETVMRRIDGSELRPPATGVHTLNCDDGLIAVDGKRVRLDLRQSGRRFAQLVRQLRTRRPSARIAPPNGKPRPQRVVHVCAQLGSYGAETVVTRLMQHTHEGDISLVAMTVARWEHPEARDTLDFPIVTIDRHERSDLFFIWRMIRELRRIRPDVVHTHAHHGRYWGRLAAVLAGVPLIVHTEHNSDLLPPAPRALFGALNRWLAPRTAAFVTFNSLRQAALGRAEGIANERISVIANGIPIGERDPGGRERARRELALEPDEVAIVMLSRLGKEKRLDLALEAFAALPAARSVRARLLLFGDGPLGAELERRARALGIASRVRFLGFRGDASTLLPGADVFLLTSAREAMPLAMIEAMVAGVPVVTVPWHGARELLEDGRYGTIAVSYEPSDIAAALEAILGDAAAAQTRAEAAAQHARAEYDVVTQTRRYAALYRRLSAATRSASARIPAARS